MSSEQLSTEPNLAAITRDTPPIERPTKRRAVRKGKGKGPPDTTQGVDNSPSGSSTYRPLAKRPMADTQEPNPTGQLSSSFSWGNPLGHQGTGFTGSSLMAWAWNSHIEKITSLVVEISLISRNARSLTTEPFYDVHVVGHAEELLFRSENLQRSYLRLTGCAQPSLVEWHFHLEKINSLAEAIWRIPQVCTPATAQLLDVNMAMLSHQSESLQQSYFALKGMVQK